MLVAPTGNCPDPVLYRELICTLLEEFWPVNLNMNGTRASGSVLLTRLGCDRCCSETSRQVNNRLLEADGVDGAEWARS
ncbi:hypothetical protein Q1695_014852 [Nippostrongylus brasiliensis]|nr:hypothetical protein Q1695_014852 [Nippostrongylus brasiliensis]